MPPMNEASLYTPHSLGDALAALHERGREGAPLAGATWVMRAPLRHEAQASAYVALSRIEALRQVTFDAGEINIGACVTHAQLALALASQGACRALAVAAGSSANAAVRNIATVGGNLCAAGFAASDLVPALVCLGADVQIDAMGGTERMSIEHLLAHRETIAPGRLIRSVIVPYTPALARRRSAHLRLPLRKAGDYPVAIVSAAVSLASNGVVDSARIAIGSVEATPRRWERLESWLVGQPLDALAAANAAERFAADFKGRDGVEAPGWYRVKVLPSLVRKAVQELIP